MDQLPTRARTFFPWTKKVYPWGVPPIVSFRPRDPHVIPLHQSTPWDDSKTRRAPSLSLIPHCPAKLFSHHGADFREACFDNRASCCSFGPVKSGLASPVKEDLSKHPVQTQLYH